MIRTESAAATRQRPTDNNRAGSGQSIDGVSNEMVEEQFPNDVLLNSFHADIKNLTLGPYFCYLADMDFCVAAYGHGRQAWKTDDTPLHLQVLAPSIELLHLDKHRREAFESRQTQAWIGPYEPFIWPFR